MTKEFNNLEEIEKYYVKETNTYAFKEDEEYIDLVEFHFDLNVDADISACDIKAHNISAWDISAHDITARDIKAYDITVRDINAHDISARNISVWNIRAFNIDAWDIKAFDIKADNISYYALCFADNNIKCKSINGRRENAKHFVLDGKLEVEE